MFKLTQGSLRKILDGQTVVDPLLHIMNIKHITNNMDGMVRYKVTLFDGESQHTFGILATQKNYLVENNQFKVGSVIRLEEYAANVLSKDPPKVVVILLNFEILGEMDIDAKPGQTMPQHQAVQNENIEPRRAVEKQPTAPTAKSFFGNKDDSSSVSVANSSRITSTNGPSSSAASGTFNGMKVVPINSLNPYQNKWSIKARVTNKSNIRTYTNAKGEGKLFNIELIDNSGEIRATGFNEQCDKFYDLLQIDNVYYISRAMLKTANKQYSKIDNDYEMTFTNDTMIEQCHDSTDNMPHINLNLVPLGELTNKNANDFVDIIGVVKSCSDLSTVTIRSTNRELTKREIHLVDDSNFSVACTLWGKQAEDFDGSENPVVLLKGAKLSDFGGRSLSVTSSTVFQLNPDLPEAHRVRGWFDQGGKETVMQELSNQTGSGSQGAGGMQNTGAQNWKTLDALKDEKIGMGDKADYFSINGTVLYAKKENSMYMACPECNKKVVDQNDGSYRCEKCAKSISNFKWRMILSINVADFTDSTWTTCFQETAELILGINADDLGDLKSSNTSKYDDTFVECVFKQFIFKLRAKMETYNDERRVKVTVVSMEPIDYVASGKRLLQKIKAYAKTQG